MLGAAGTLSDAAGAGKVTPEQAQDEQFEMIIALVG